MIMLSNSIITNSVITNSVITNLVVTNINLTKKLKDLNLEMYSYTSFIFIR